MKFTGGTAQELINWQKREGYKFPVISAPPLREVTEAVESLSDYFLSLYAHKTEQD